VEKSRWKKAGWEAAQDLVASPRMKALIFDLDGTLVDSVYAHVLAWQLAFAEAGMPIDGWRLHRRMGMSGGLFKRAVMRELGRTISMPRLKALDKRHGELFRQFLPKPRPLPGAVELLRFLRRNKIVHGIATSNQRPNINPSLKALGVTKDTVVVESGDVARAKPEPDLFLECQKRLGVEVKDCYVVGDAVWDLMAARRAGMLSVGLLSGGYGEDELVRAAALGDVPRCRRPPQLPGRAGCAAIKQRDPIFWPNYLEGRIGFRSCWRSESSLAVVLDRCEGHKRHGQRV
jgi:HAD superfamily hydrolase (TIGR01509 family)